MAEVAVCTEIVMHTVYRCCCCVFNGG